MCYSIYIFSVSAWRPRLPPFSYFIGYPVEGTQGNEVVKVIGLDDLEQRNVWSPTVGKLANIEFTLKGRIRTIKTV
jgi:hypothetical protein